MVQIITFRHYHNKKPSSALQKLRLVNSFLHLPTLMTAIFIIVSCLILIPHYATAATSNLNSDISNEQSESLTYELLPESPPYYIPPDQITNNSTLDSTVPPADSASTEQSNADLWQRIKDGYAMPEASSKLVKKHEEAYLKRPDMISNMVNRSQKYLFHIVEEVQNRGMPTEIALLPMIESAYNPTARSSAKAVGIWQFMPSTGSVFGLKQNWWVDNRRNITFATDAALTYLQKLHAMFGAWDLALAAYNAGEGNVKRAIKKNQQKGLPTDYNSLDLPRETRNYVPKLQAIKNIMTNPSNFGIEIKTIENKAYFTNVTAPAQIDSHLAAKLAGISDEEFVALNPAYNRPVITSNGETHELLLPIDAAATFQENLANYNKPLVSWKPYTAKRGESLATIANKFDIRADQLRRINQLPSQNKINKSTTILVPNGNKTDDVIALNDDNKSQMVKSDIDISNLQSAENIDTKQVEKLQAQQKIEEKNTTDVDKSAGITYQVKNGDTLDKIAKKFSISAKTISQLNQLKKNKVKIGQKLIIKPSAKQKNNKMNAKKNSNQTSQAKHSQLNKKLTKNKGKKNTEKNKTSTRTSKMNKIMSKSTTEKRKPVRPFPK